MFTIGLITPTSAVIILLVVLFIFGPGKLPEVGRSLGNGIRSFKDAMDSKVEEDTTKKDQELKE